MMSSISPARLDSCGIAQAPKNPNLPQDHVFGNYLNCLSEQLSLLHNTFPIPFARIWSLFGTGFCFFQKYLFSISFGISLDKLASLLYLTKLRFFVSAALTCGDSTRVFCFSTQYTKPGCHFARVQCISGHSSLPPCCWHVFPIHNTTIPQGIIGQGVATITDPAAVFLQILQS